MRKDIKLIIGVFTIVILAGLLSCSSSRKSGETDRADGRRIDSLIQNKRFVFVAESVTPLGSRIRNLTGGYELDVMNDTLIYSLPYFGRAYSAPYNPAENDFTTSNFSYTSNKGSKGNWDVVIKLRNVTEVSEIYLSASASGMATVNVNSNTRQSISYNGYITSVRQGKKLK